MLSNYAQTATSSEMADSLFEIDSMRDLGCWQQSHRVYLDALTEGGTPPIAVP